MKKRLFSLILLGFIAVFGFFGGEIAFADEATQNGTGDVSSVEESVDELDLSELERLFSELDETEQTLFGGDIVGYIKKTASGESGIGFEGFISYVLASLGASVKDVLPLVATVAGIAMAVALVGGIKGNFGGSSVDKAVSMAGVALCSITVLLSVFSAVKSVCELAGNLRTQSEAVFPVLFTLMSALGASGSIAVYQPAVAVLTFSITELITAVALPLTIASLAAGVVSGITDDGEGTASIAKFTSSSAKWVMCTAYFLFIAFLSVKGATAAVCDNVSVRTAKFALSKYVPVIGGYLSEGFNTILASVALIKNAVGGTAVLIMVVTVLPVLIKTILTMLSLRLAEAVAGTLGGGRIKKVLSGASDACGVLIAIVAGAAFSYFIFLMLIIVSGNLVL